MKRIFAGALALALLLSACALLPGQEETGVALYFRTVGGESAVDAEYRGGTAEETAVPELVQMLLDGPEDSQSFASPFPSGVRLRNWTLEDGRCTLDFSEQYGALSGVSLTIADACIALTLGQLPQVEWVVVKVEGLPVSFRAIQNLSVQDILLTDNETEPVSVNHRFYFPLADLSGLKGEERQVRRGENDTLLAAVLRDYFAGPGDGQGALTSLLPEGTQLLDATVKNGVCYLDLSAEFVRNAPAGKSRQRLLLYSLVNTLGELKNITAVRIRVEGATVETYGGVDLTAAIAPDLAAVKTVDGPAE